MKFARAFFRITLAFFFTSVYFIENMLIEGDRFITQKEGLVAQVEALGLKTLDVTGGELFYKEFSDGSLQFEVVYPTNREEEAKYEIEGSLAMMTGEEWVDIEPNFSDTTKGETFNILTYVRRSSPEGIEALRKRAASLQ